MGGGERENALEMSLLLGTMAFFFFLFYLLLFYPSNSAKTKNRLWVCCGIILSHVSAYKELWLGLVSVAALINKVSHEHHDPIFLSSRLNS